jgi:hypothetical protein
MAKNKRRSVAEEHTNNYFVLALLLLALIGVVTGAIQEVFAGTVYFSIILAGAVALVLVNFFTNEDDKKRTKEFFMSPFKKDSRVALALFYFGTFVILLLNYGGQFIKQGFSTLQFFSPLYLTAGGELGTGISQTFSASVLESSGIVSWFFTVFTAGIWEEFLFGFILFFVGWVIAIALNQTIFGNRFGKIFNNIVATGISVSLFMVVHILNGSYEGSMFLVAGIFRLLMNISIYYLTLGIAFTMGMHLMNNHLAYVVSKGFQEWMWILVLIYLIGMLALLIPTKQKETFGKLIQKLMESIFRG